MARLKKPKMKKLPRKPKASASLATLQNYVKKHKETLAENAKRKSDYEKTKKAHEAIKKTISGLKR